MTQGVIGFLQYLHAQLQGEEQQQLAQLLYTRTKLAMLSLLCSYQMGQGMQQSHLGGQVAAESSRLVM